MKKTLYILIILILIICFFSTSVYALTLDELDGSGAKTENVQRVGANILTYISIIASAASIVTLIILGIKYMLGSLEERAQYKKSLLPYFIGAIFVFGATTIPTIIYNMVK